MSKTVVRCRSRRLAGPLVLAALACTRGDAARRNAGAGVDIAGVERARAAAIKDPRIWPEYGRDFTNQRYSPLTQITAANVSQLKPAWIHHSHIPHASETNPIVIDGVMYFTSALNHVFAVDARTGAQKWEYAYDYGGRTTADCCSTNNKGPTIYGGRVFMETVDARLVALDARNGQELWRATVGDNDKGYHMTGAPFVIDGRVIVGVSGGEQGCRCYVDAYDVNDGHRLWRFYTVPSPAEGGWWGKWRATDEWGMSFHRDIAKEKADSAKYPDAWMHGGAPMWHHPAYDPESGLIFLNVGNPAPDLEGAIRPGDNLYSDAIVALDPKVGKLRWYYQEIAHDLWDYDATTPPVLVEVPDGAGRMVKAVAEAGKDGFVYVVDRATGKPIRKSAQFVPFLNYMTPPDTDGVVVAPGPLGGSDWSPTAYDPNSHLMFVDGSYQPFKYWVKHEELKAPAQWWGGTVAAAPSGAYGLVSAVDLGTGKIAWQTRFPKPLIGGLLATAGGVVFTGSSDKHFVALDARTGRQIWSYPTDAGVNAPPISYEIDGVQYVAVAATGLQTLNTPRGDAMLVFSLPAKP